MATKLDYRFLKVAATDPGLENDGQNGLRVKINPTGGILLDSTGISVDKDQINELTVIEHVLTADDVSNKTFTLPTAMADTNQIALVVYGGMPLNYGVDYTANSSTIVGWNGLGMDGLVETGDEIQAIYPI